MNTHGWSSVRSSKPDIQAGDGQALHPTHPRILYVCMTLIDRLCEDGGYSVPVTKHSIRMSWLCHCTGYIITILVYRWTTLVHWRRDACHETCLCISQNVYICHVIITEFSDKGRIPIWQQHLITIINWYNKIKYVIVLKINITLFLTFIYLQMVQVLSPTVNHHSFRYHFSLFLAPSGTLYILYIFILFITFINNYVYCFSFRYVGVC